MSNKRTLKALEELVKTENMAIAALDSALDQVDDSRLRKTYKKWRDSHIKQAEALNKRLEELGGEPIAYEVGTGKGQAGLWGMITSVRDDTSLAGMRIGAERGIKRYVDHLDEIDDAKALNIIRKNLESKQDEMEWYDEMSTKERVEKLDTKLEASREKVAELQHDGNGKKKAGFALPLLLVAGAIGAAAFVLLRRGEEDEWDDYGEDAFTYETEDIASDSGYTSAGTFTAGGEQTS